MIEVKTEMSTIRELREKREWSQYDLANAARVGTVTISKMENGKPVSRNSFLRVCDALNVNHVEVEGVSLIKRYPSHSA